MSLILLPVLHLLLLLIASRVTGGGGGGTPGQFSSTPGLDVVTSASDTLLVTAIGTIFDLDVMLDIPHAYTSDMEITLTSPSTTSVLIVDSVGRFK
jgi:hypothetical protein